MGLGMVFSAWAEFAELFVCVKRYASVEHVFRDTGEYLHLYCRSRQRSPCPNGYRTVRDATQFGL